MHARIPGGHVLRQVLSAQRDEITMGEIYTRIASTIGDPRTRAVLLGIAGKELEDYKFLKEYTACDVSPDRFQLFVATLFLKVLGYTFTLKFLATRHSRYVNRAVLEAIPDAGMILRKGEAHLRKAMTES
jgi:hypothetical protein